MTEMYRFAAFISYDSSDGKFVKKLHRTLERYKIPRDLGRFDITGGGKPNRIYPVFTDREELAAGELREAIQAALRASAYLIVICSPESIQSEWVREEINYFKELGRTDRIIPVICDTASSDEEAIEKILPRNLRLEDGFLLAAIF